MTTTKLKLIGLFITLAALSLLPDVAVANTYPSLQMKFYGYGTSSITICGANQYGNDNVCYSNLATPSTVTSLPNWKWEENTRLDITQNNTGNRGETQSCYVAPDSPGSQWTSCYSNYVYSSQLSSLGAQHLVNSDGNYQLYMQPDGNLVEYKNGKGAVWSSGTYHAQNAAYSLALQSSTDGNLVIYGPSGAIWCPGWGTNYYPLATPPHPGDYLELRSGGKVEVVSSSGTDLWDNGYGH